MIGKTIRLCAYPYDVLYFDPLNYGMSYECVRFNHLSSNLTLPWLVFDHGCKIPLVIDGVTHSRHIIITLLV